MSDHQVGAYLDGALAADAETRFLDHLVDCAACQAELHAEVQLRDREDALRAAAPTPRVEAPVIPIGCWAMCCCIRRRRRTTI